MVPMGEVPITLRPCLECKHALLLTVVRSRLTVAGLLIFTRQIYG